MKNIHSSSNFLNDCALYIQFIKKIIVETYPPDIIQLRRFQLHLSEISDYCCIVRYLHNDVLKCENRKGQKQF